MSTSLGRGRGARVKLDSKVGRVAAGVSTNARKQNLGMTTPPVSAPSQVAFPASQGPEISLPVSVIKALKSGCASIEQLLQLSAFLLSYGGALETTHSDIVSELFAALRRYVHSPHIPANRVRAVRLAVLRLLEIRQQGWITASSADAYYKQHILQLAEPRECVPNSCGSTSSVRDVDSRPSSSLSNHEVAKRPPSEEAWESLGVESLSIRETKEESAFNEANNATGTPAVQQFNCIPQGLNAAEGPPCLATTNIATANIATANVATANLATANLATANSLANVGVNGIIPASVEEPRAQEREPLRSTDLSGTAPSDCDSLVNPLAPPPTISTANLHSRYLTNSKGQTLIISACSPLIVGMAENILLRQIPTLQSMPTQLEMVTRQKRSTKDESVQCDLLHDKSFGAFGAPTTAGPSTGHSPPSAFSSTVDLFVRHLHESVDDRILFDAFKTFDELLNARVQTDDDGYSKGYGFVSFGSLEAASAAAAAMNGAELRTKRLFVDLAKRKEDMKSSEREHDDHQNKPVYSHFTKPTYQRSKSEVSASGRSANRQIDDPLFDDTDICGVEEFGAVESGTPASARPLREAPPRDTGGVKWHVTGKSRGVAPPSSSRDYQDRPLSSVRVSLDPRGRYCDDDEIDDVAGEEEAGRRSCSPDSPRAPFIVGPWLKMAFDFAGRREAGGDIDAIVGEPQPMEKLLQDIPSSKEPSRYRQFLLALSLSPLSQEPPLENWEMYCRQQNDCCVECMSEAFHPIRYLDYWERTSPQERYNRRPAYEEHDHRKADYSKSYDEHDCRKVDYAKLYEDRDRRKTDFAKPFGPPKPPVPTQRLHDSFSGPSARTPASPTSVEPSSFSREEPTSSVSTLESSDLTLVSALESADDVVHGSKSPHLIMPAGFESQSTIICEDQLSALMLSTDFDEGIDKGAMGDSLGIKVLSSTADDSLIVNISGQPEGMKKFDGMQS